MNTNNINPSRHYQHQYIPLNTDPFTGVPLDWNAHPMGVPTEKLNLPLFIEEWQKRGASYYVITRSKFFKIPDEEEQYTKTLEWIMNLQLYQCGGICKELQTERKGKDGSVEGWNIWIVWYEIRGYIPK